jgi:hypothetical protein
MFTLRIVPEIRVLKGVMSALKYASFVAWSRRSPSHPVKSPAIPKRRPAATSKTINGMISDFFPMP